MSSREDSAAPKGRGRGRETGKKRKNTSLPNKGIKKIANLSTPAINFQYKNSLREYGSPQAISNLNKGHQPLIPNTKRNSNSNSPSTINNDTPGPSSQTNIDNITDDDTTPDQNKNNHETAVSRHMDSDIDPNENLGTQQKTTNTINKGKKPSPIYVTEIEFNDLTTMLTLHDIPPDASYVNTFLEDKEDNTTDQQIRKMTIYSHI
uniref:Uncharacterized protein n=1 Tax=Bracon brevicornis TaxID=1563983 RepID=A0A6V7J501_9HYME